MESLVELLSAMIRAKWKHRELGPTIFILVFLSMTFLIFRPDKPQRSDFKTHVVKLNTFK